MNSMEISIPISQDEKVSGVLSIPDGFQPSKTIGVILAHGSGNDMQNPLSVAAANGLCREGYLTLRFNPP